METNLNPGDPSAEAAPDPAPPFPGALHPGTRILAWIALAALLQFLTGLPLAALSALLLLAALAGAPGPFLSLCRRARWLLLSILLIHAFTLPGAPAWPWSDWPTAEGLNAGLAQVLRLVALLGALALLLARVPGEHTLAGLHALLAPLRGLGVDTSRPAVRLWLTLEYARSQTPRPLAEMLAGWDADDPAGPRRVRLPAARLGAADLLVLAGGAALLALIA